MPSNRISCMGEFGALLITPGALQALEEAGESPVGLVQRYLAGEPGDLGGEAQAALERFAADEEKPVVGYQLAGGVELWLIVGGPAGLSTLVRPEER